MLYITTRNNVDTFTSRIPLLSDTAQGGGHFLPHRIPQYSGEEILALEDISFSQTVANILNTFFPCKLNALDVDFTIGKNAVQLKSVNHRVLFAELWHNPDNCFAYMTQHLHDRLLETGNMNAATDWSKTAVVIAVLFGLYGKLLRDCVIARNTEIDISVPADDFLLPMAAWYARKMGLPIKTIICACNDSNNIWELFHRGSLITNQVPETMLLGLEKIIYMTLGQEDTNRFLTCCNKGSVFTVSEKILPSLGEGFYCSVAGENRAETMINSIYRSNAYITDPATAICYGGAQDYRASTGNSRPVILLSQQSPLIFANQIIHATGITEAELNSAVRR